MINVFPIYDLAEHTCDAGCWCRPKIITRELEAGDLLQMPVVSHNSLDRREAEELLKSSDYYCLMNSWEVSPLSSYPLNDKVSRELQRPLFLQFCFERDLENPLEDKFLERMKKNLEQAVNKIPFAESLLSRSGFRLEFISICFCQSVFPKIMLVGGSPSKEIEEFSKFAREIQKASGAPIISVSAVNEQEHEQKTGQILDGRIFTFFHAVNQ